MKELKFNAEMQRAIDEGRKTQTRRVVAPSSFDANSRTYQWVPDKFGCNHLFTDKFGNQTSMTCPFGNIGTINNGVRITDIKVERLCDISQEDAQAEGVKIDDEGMECWNYLNEKFEWIVPEESFKSLWKSIYSNHPQKAWELNPWVWVIEFEQVNN